MAAPVPRRGGVGRRGAGATCWRADPPAHLAHFQPCQLGRHSRPRRRHRLCVRVERRARPSVGPLDGRPKSHALRAPNPAQRDRRPGERHRRRLERGQPLVLFPEGTTGPGDHLLPFRSALLAAVAPAPDGVDVRPVAIDYGPAAREIGWHGERGKANVLRVLGRKGTIPAVVRVLPPLDQSSDRKLLAHHAREKIAAALAASSSARTGL